MEDQQRILRMDAAGRTDVGEARRAAGLPDEDTVFLARFRDVAHAGGVRALYAVADGVSQRRGGKVASAQAINMLEEAIEYYARRGESGIPGIDDLDSFLDYVFVRIDETLKSFAANNETIAGMASTLTAAVIVGNLAKVVHAGDSRAYLVPAGAAGAKQLTEDQTTTDESGQPIPSNAVGCLTDQVRVSRTDVELRDGDKLLLCSDGLWREVGDEDIERIVRQSTTPAAAVDCLIRLANERGGSGNVAAIVCHFGEAAARETVVAPPARTPEAPGQPEPPARPVVPTPPTRGQPTERAAAPLSAVRDRAAEASGQLVAFLVGVGLTLIAVLFLWMATRAVGSLLSRRAEPAGPAEVVEVPLWLWYDKGNPPPDRCPVEVGTYDRSGEQRWKPVVGESGTQVEARKQKSGDAATYDVLLRVRLNEDVNADEPMPLPTRFRIKIGKNPVRVVRQPEGQGVIEVTHNVEATVTVTAAGGGEPLRQVLREVPEGGYRAEFRNLKYGDYVVRGAGLTYQVILTEQNPRQTLRLSVQPTPASPRTP